MSATGDEILGGVAGAVALAVGTAAIRWGRRRVAQRTVEVRLTFAGDLSPGAHPLLCFVRDGKDGVDGRGDIVNALIPLKPSGHRQWRAEVKTVGRLGFQYHCCVEVRDGLQDDAARLLESTGFTEVAVERKEPGSPPLVWFLITGESTCLTVDGHTNNFCRHGQQAVVGGTAIDA